MCSELMPGYVFPEHRAVLHKFLFTENQHLVWHLFSFFSARILKANYSHHHLMPELYIF